MRKTLLATLAVLLSPGPSAAADPQMKPGLWEISAKIEVTGMSYMTPEQTLQHCYTEEEVAQAEGPVPQQQGDCKLEDTKRVGNKLSWKIVCAGQSAGEGEGEIVFTSATSYEGWMKFASQGQVMTTRYSARRLGDCR
jgi:hypothetical protein